MNKIVDTVHIENFLSDEEIDYIENIVGSSGYEPYKYSTVDGSPLTEIQSFDLYTDLYFAGVRDILLPKLQKTLSKDLNVNASHILTSFTPYKLHTDGGLEYGIDHVNFYGSWTCVVPFETCNSQTISFNEYFEGEKSLQAWFNEMKPEKKCVIDDETYQKYFTHIPRHFIDYFSIESIFNWKKGDLWAASRYKFHTSSNYLNQNMTSKRGLIMWTTLPYQT